MTRQLTVDIAVPSQCYLAEGPVWDPAARLLRWVDINPGHVHAFDPATGAHSRFAPAGPDGPAVPRDDAVPVGAVAKKPARFRAGTQSRLRDGALDWPDGWGI